MVEHVRRSRLESTLERGGEDHSSEEGTQGRPLTKNRPLSQEVFVSLPVIGSIPGYRQPKGSRDSTTSRLSGASASKRGELLREGDLVTGTINVVHERAHMVPTVRNPNRQGEKAEIVCVHSFLVENLA